jgi:hypothetical protein
MDDVERLVGAIKSSAERVTTLAVINAERAVIEAAREDHHAMRAIQSGENDPTKNMRAIEAKIQLSKAVEALQAAEREARLDSQRVDGVRLETGTAFVYPPDDTQPLTDSGDEIRVGDAVGHGSKVGLVTQEFRHLTVLWDDGGSGYYANGYLASDLTKLPPELPAERGE